MVAVELVITNTFGYNDDPDIDLIIFIIDITIWILIHIIYFIINSFL